jgi:molybdenum-dependent DNA-binding transcriptional regulator ModE
LAVFFICIFISVRFWEGEPDDETKKVTSRISALKAAAKATAKKVREDAANSKRGSILGDDGSGGVDEDESNSERARHILNRLEAAHFKALKERQAKRRRFLGGPLRGLVGRWAGRGRGGGGGGGASTPPLQAALSTLYEMLEAKVRKDRHDLFEASCSSTASPSSSSSSSSSHHHHCRLVPLVEFAETFFLQRYGLPSLSKNTMRAALCAIQKHFKRFQKRYGGGFAAMAASRPSSSSQGGAAGGAGVSAAASEVVDPYHAHHNQQRPLLLQAQDQSAGEKAELRLFTRLRLLMQMLLLDDEQAATRSNTDAPLILVRALNNYVVYSYICSSRHYQILHPPPGNLRRVCA